MGKYRRLGKNILLIFVGNAGSKLILLFMLPFYTRWLTPSDYGSSDLVSTYSGLMLGILSCCIYDAIFLFPKDRPKNIQKGYISTAILFWFVTISIVGIVCLIIKSLGEKYGWSGFVYKYLWWMYLLFVVNYLQSVLQQFLRSIDKMVVYSTTGVVITISMVIFGFLLIPNGGGVHGYLSSIVLANILAILYSLIYGGIWRYFSVRSANSSTLFEMLKYSLPLIPNGIMFFFISSFNRPVLESYAGLAAVGIFALANRFPSVLNTVYLLFQNAWLISVIEEAKKPSYETFYNRLLKIVVAGQSLLTVGLAFCGKWIIKLFATPEYYSAWQYIPLLVIGVIFMNIATFVGSNFAVTRESKYYFYSTVWAGGASVILNFTLIPFWGLWGATVAMLLSQVIGMITRIKYSWKTVRITNIGFYCRNGLFVFGSVAASLTLQSSNILYLVIAICMAYFIYVNYHQLIGAVDIIKQHYKKVILQ